MALRFVVASLLFVDVFAAPVLSKHDNEVLTELEVLMSARRCVYDSCAAILVEGADIEDANGLYTPDPRRSCLDDNYGTAGYWAGYINANNAVLGTSQRGDDWDGWNIATSGHARYSHPGKRGATVEEIATTFPAEYDPPLGGWIIRSGRGSAPAPTKVTCISAMRVEWNGPWPHHQAEFATTATTNYSETTKRATEFALSLEVSYGKGYKASGSYKNAVSRTVTKGMMNTQTETCNNPCNPGSGLYYLRYVGAIVATPECGLVTCVPPDPQGQARVPQCPLEYCGGDLQSGCQCCTSHAFIDPSYTGERPPLCDQRLVDWVPDPWKMPQHSDNCVHDSCPVILVEGAGRDDINGVYTPDPRTSCHDAEYRTGSTWQGYLNPNGARLGFGPESSSSTNGNRDWTEGWRIETSNGHIRYHHPFLSPANSRRTLPEGVWLSRTGGGHGEWFPNPSIKCLNGVNVGWRIASSNPTATFGGKITKKFSEHYEEATERAASAKVSYKGVSVSSSYTEDVQTKSAEGESTTELVNCPNLCDEDRNLWVQELVTAAAVLVPQCGKVACVPYGLVPQCPIEECGDHGTGRDETRLRQSKSSKFWVPVLQEPRLHRPHVHWHAPTFVLRILGASVCTASAVPATLSAPSIPSPAASQYATATSIFSTRAMYRCR